MTTDSTYRMLRAYEEKLDAPMFLTGFAQSPPENFHRSEKIAIDIVRAERTIAVPLPSIGAGAREISRGKYVSKELTPPVYDTEATISAYEGLKRRAGNDPFEDPGFLRDAVAEAERAMREIQGMTDRAVEAQVAQALTTGLVSLVDSTGAVIHTEDFKPKSTHHVTVSTAWGPTTGSPLADLGNLARVIRNDGKVNPNILVMGPDAFNAFTGNQDVKARLDNRRIEVGAIRPEPRGMGATRYGYIWVDTYEFEIWLYNEEYIHPASGVSTPYLPRDKVLMLSDETRIDLTFGALPMFAGPDARAAQFMPGRFSYSERSVDLTVNAWFTNDGKHLKVSAGTRPLCFPTAIDAYGTLDVAP